MVIWIKIAAGAVGAALATFGIKSAVDKQKLQNQNEDLQNQNMDLTNRNDKLNSQNADLQNQNRALKNEKNNLVSKNSELKTKNDELLEKYSQSEAEEENNEKLMQLFEQDPFDISDEELLGDEE